MISGAMVAGQARTWLGTPYVHQASLKAKGCDCIGLVRGVAREVGFKDPFKTGEARKFAGYGRQPKAADLIEACLLYLQPIPKPTATLGDILLLRYEKDPQHFALISRLDPMHIIHAFTPERRVVENPLSGKWPMRVMMAFRYKELA